MRSKLSTIIAVLGIMAVGVSAAGGTSFSDNFDRSDSTTLGNGWTEVIGDLKILSNELRNEAITAYHTAVQDSLSGSYQDVSADFAKISSTAVRFGVVLRYQDPQNFYWICRLNGGTSAVRIYKIQNGVETQLGTASQTNQGNNVWFTLRGVANGNTLKAYYNGTEKVSVTDSTWSSGKAGIRFGPATNTDSHRADNFSALIDPIPPTAEFSGSPTSGNFPLNVNFTDLSTGYITGWSWNFGDSGTSTAQNPSHTYTSAGSFTVSLTTTGPVGSDAEVKTNYIIATTPSAPVADFTGSPTSGNYPLAVSFTDQSTGYVTAWSWTFGDSGTSTEQNPSHTYTANGTYTVSLTASGPGGSSTETKTNYITVNIPPPTAAFTGEPEEGAAPLVVGFTDMSSGTVTTWSWTFGDSGTSTARNPAHQYSAIGNYTVSLSVAGPYGTDIETLTDYIAVLAPVANDLWITYDKTTTNDMINNNNIRGLFADGSIRWIGTNGGGMSRFNGSSWTLYKTTEGLVNNYPWRFDKDPAGNLWIATNGGVSKFNGTSFTNYTTSNSGLSDNNTRDVAVDSDGTTVWITTQGGGVCKFTGTSWTAYKSTNSPLPNNTAWGVEIDSAGNKWFTTMGGVAKFNGTSWSVYIAQLPNNDVYDVALDSAENPWFATAGGICKFNGSSWTVYTVANGMPNDNTRAIDVDSNDVVWVGTYNGGVCRLEAGNWTQYTASNSPLANNYSWAVCAASPMELWLGTNLGVTVYKIQGGEIPPLPGSATSLSPANGATGVSITANLTWTAGSNAVSHDLYLSTDSTVDVNDFVRNQTGATFDLGTMPYTTTYYWRVDERNSSGRTVGSVLSFTTEDEPQPPGQATNPNPANQAASVSVIADLSWTAGTEAASHDVYFGTTNPPPFIRNQTAATYDTGTMSYTTTYYWRIDEKNIAGTTTGTVWSFTTGQLLPPGQASNPNPANGATSVNVNADLSWSAGSGATSHDVYFSTTNPPVFVRNQAGTNYDPGTMASSKTYYWRIDEKNAAGTTTGSVWNFTTATGGPSGPQAFPGAEGFGAGTAGGRGGTIIKVTNLNDSGTGSLRAACSASGARIVVFNVSGTITLSSDIAISNPYITIAGQTSPGGICLRKYGLNPRTHDVVIRHIRSRAGNESGDAVHGVNINNGAYNVILDHCSLSWGVDEDAGVGGSSHDITFQRCIISEGLYNAGHPEGHHSCGFINNPSDTNISLHHNLFALNDERNPRSHGGVVDARNNVIYHPGSSCAYLGGDGYFQTNWVKNYMLGANRRSVKFLSGTSGKVYVQGNKDPYRTSDSQSEWTVVDGSESVYRSSTPFTAPAITEIDVFPTNLLFDNVLDNCGATLPVRDAVDTRIVDDVRNETGGFINTPSDVGGWPTLSGGSPPTDTDGDGMPDSWETPRGLNPNSNDSAGDRDGDGYTNIEEYINGIPW